MELHQVRYYLAACETNSFTRAAARCHVSQPAFTAAMSKLEEELGGRLFDRDHGGARMTSLGASLRPRFQRLAHDFDAVAAAARDEVQQHAEQVRIGVMPSLGSGRVVPWLVEFRRRAPGVWLETVVDASAGLVERLRDGDVDVVLTNLDGEAAPPWSVAVELYDEPYVALLPATHRLLKAAQVRLRDLLDEPYVDRAACELRPKVMSLLAEEGLSLRAVFRAERDEWVPGLVEAGMGYALLPAFSVRTGAATVRPLVEPALNRRISMLRNAERPFEAPARGFWELARGS